MASALHSVRAAPRALQEQLHSQRVRRHGLPGTLEDGVWGGPHLASTSNCLPSRSCHPHAQGVTLASPAELLPSVAHLCVRACDAKNTPTTLRSSRKWAAPLEFSIITGASVGRKLTAPLRRQIHSVWGHAEEGGIIAPCPGDDGATYSTHSPLLNFRLITFASEDAWLPPHLRLTGSMAVLTLLRRCIAPALSAAPLPTTSAAAAVEAHAAAAAGVPPRNPMQLLPSLHAASSSPAAQAPPIAGRRRSCDLSIAIHSIGGSAPTPWRST